MRSSFRKRRETTAPAVLKERRKSRNKALQSQMVRLKNDTVVLKKNIAKLETLLRVHSGLTEENRKAMETKLKSWYDLLNNVHVAETEEEKQIRYAALKQNQGLCDVFDLFWLLVLPFCELDPIEKTRIIEARKKNGTDRKRRGALGSGSQSQSFVSGMTGDTNDTNIEEPKVVYLTRKGYVRFYVNIYIALTDNRNEKQYIKHAKDAWEQEMLVAINEQRALMYDDDDASIVGSLASNESPKNMIGDKRVNTRKVTMSKERFFSNLYDILDVWAELLDPKYQTIFAWSLLESVADLQAYPPKLKLPRAVTCNTHISNEANMLSSFLGGEKQRSYLSVKNDVVTRMPEVLSRLAARKKGGTLSEEEALQVHQIYLELKRQGKLFQNDATAYDSDDDDDDGVNRSGREGDSDDSVNLNFGSDDGSDDSDGQGGRRGHGWRDKYNKKDLQGRKLYANDMDIKSTSLARLRQREKFIAVDQFDMKNRAKFKLANPAQANSVQKLILNKKLSSEEASEERKNRLYSQSLKSPVIKGFRYKGGHLAHWQYASSAIPPEDEEDELAAFLKQREAEDMQMSQRRLHGMVLVEKTGATLGDTSTDDNNFHDLYKDEKLKARLAKIRKFLGISIEGDQFESIILDRLKAAEASKQEILMKQRATKSERIATRRRTNYKEAMKIMHQTEQSQELIANIRKGHVTEDNDDDDDDGADDLGSEYDHQMKYAEKQMLTKVTRIQRLLAEEGAYDIHELMTMAMTDMASDEDKLKLAEEMAKRGNDVFGEEQAYHSSVNQQHPTYKKGPIIDQRKRSVLISEMHLGRKNSILHDSALMKMINRPMSKKKRNTMMNPTLEPLFNQRDKKSNILASNSIREGQKEYGEGSRDLDLASVNTPALQLLNQLSQELSMTLSNSNVLHTKSDKPGRESAEKQLKEETLDNTSISALYASLVQNSHQDRSMDDHTYNVSLATYDQLIGLQQGVLKQIDALRPVLESKGNFKDTPLEAIWKQHGSKRIGVVIMECNRDEGNGGDIVSGNSKGREGLEGDKTAKSIENIAKDTHSAIINGNEGEELPPFDDSVSAIESLKSDPRAPSPQTHGTLQPQEEDMPGSLAVVGQLAPLNVTSDHHDTYGLSTASMVVRGEEILAGGWDIDWTELDNWLNINTPEQMQGVEGDFPGKFQSVRRGRWDENIKELGDFYQKGTGGSKPGTPSGGSKSGTPMGNSPFEGTPLITPRKGSRQSSRQSSRQGTPRLEPIGDTAPSLQRIASNIEGVEGEADIGSTEGRTGAMDAQLSRHVHASLNRLNALHKLSVDSGAPLEVDVYSWVYSLPGFPQEDADRGNITPTSPLVSTSMTSGTFPSKWMMPSFSQNQLGLVSASTDNIIDIDNTAKIGEDAFPNLGTEVPAMGPEVHSLSDANRNPNLTVSFEMDDSRAQRKKEKLARKEERRKQREIRKKNMLADILTVREEGLSRFKTRKL